MKFAIDCDSKGVYAHGRKCHYENMPIQIYRF